MDDSAPRMRPTRRFAVGGACVSVLAAAWPGLSFAGATSGLGGALTNEDVLSLVRLGLGDDVVVAKIRQAGRVAFRLEVADLSALRDRGASGPVIVAMLDRARQVEGAGPVVKEGRILLRGRDGLVELVGTAGDVERKHAVVAILSSLTLPGENAVARTSDSRPSFLLPTPFRPDGIWFLVRGRMDSSGGRRSFAARTSTILTGRQAFLPHDDSLVPVHSEELEAGLWRLWPQDPLDSGEYAIWRVRDATAGAAAAWLYDFGVDDVAGRSWGRRAEDSERLGPW